jgi:hypothetical protein
MRAAAPLLGPELGRPSTAVHTVGWQSAAPVVPAPHPTHPIAEALPLPQVLLPAKSFSSIPTITTADVQKLL